MSPNQENIRRVFFALWPNAEERSALSAWQQPLLKLCGGRRMRDETLHATLVFLGEIVEHSLESLQLAAQEVDAQRFELLLSESRYWGHNHIVYAAPETVPPQLIQLVTNLECKLRKHHFHFEPRPFKPHITLLRHAKFDDKPLPEMPEVIWQVRDFVLVQSMNDEQGARYEVLARFSLR
jgi:2'-5' RNA ligase